MKIFTLRNWGITSVEVVIGVSIAALIVVYAMNSISLYVNGARDVSDKTQALYLAEEGLELVRFIRDQNWTNISSLTINTPYYIGITGTNITTTTTPQTFGIFTRSFTVQNVYRDSSSSDIVSSSTGGSVADTSSKYVTVTVAWSTKSLSLTSIVTDIAP
jgi:hypothetical protein